MGEGGPPFSPPMKRYFPKPPPVFPVREAQKTNPGEPLGDLGTRTRPSARCGVIFAVATWTRCRGAKDGTVRVHAILHGPAARRLIECLRAEAPQYPNRNFYVPWPGPNSNTFVDVMLRKCDWEVDLPATAVGKDYRGFFGASLTSGGTGVQLESPLVGIKIGAKEGLEIHILALTFGFDFWPLAIKVPGGVGRIGWEDR